VVVVGSVVVSVVGFVSFPRLGLAVVVVVNFPARMAVGRVM